MPLTIVRKFKNLDLLNDHCVEQYELEKKDKPYESLMEVVNSPTDIYPFFLAEFEGKNVGKEKLGFDYMGFKKGYDDNTELLDIAISLVNDLPETKKIMEDIKAKVKKRSEESPNKSRSKDLNIWVKARCWEILRDICPDDCNIDLDGDQIHIYPHS